MKEKEERKILVRDLMTPGVVSVDPSTTIQKVAKLMETEKIGSVVVIDDDKPVGIITERDFAVKMASDAYNSETKVSVIMSSPVIHVSPNQSVVDVIDHMSKKNIRRIPVVENGKVVGIITGTNFLRLFSRCTDKDMKNLYQRFLERIYSNVSF